jgi:hypothetical protein
MTKTYTEFCQGKLGDAFTGVVHSDVGSFNYAAVLGGKILTAKGGSNRWFKTEQAAQAALDLAQNDLLVQDHGSIVLLRGNSEAGRAWIAEHIPSDAQWWSGAVVVEPRYIGAIVDGAIADGLAVA